MKNIYLKTILKLITLNAILTATLAFLSGWDPTLIMWSSIRSSIFIALLFTPYFFFQIKKINTNKLLNTIFIWLPSIIMMILLLKKIYQLFSIQNRFGDVSLGGFAAGGFLKPIHLQLMLTIIITHANYLQFKKNNLMNEE